MERLLRDGRLRKLLEHGDEDLARECREGGCGLCGGALHSAKYERKPRGPAGFEAWDRRHSFCCAQEGCRKRHTPASLRFLGRRVYVSVVVVLAAAMMHGLKPQRVERLRQTAGLDARTLNRWRAWWMESFVGSGFWKGAKGRLMPPVDEKRMPLSLVEAFGAQHRECLVKLLDFLAPITVPGRKGVAAM
jgi:hypothetical protein